jgi:capsular polysaccharide transport system permease protein
MNVETPIRTFATTPANDPSLRRASVLHERRIPWLFIAMVAIPTLLAAIYFLLIASPLYVSEARFVVRSRAEGQPAGLGSVLQNVGQSFGVSFGQSSTDAFEVHEYMISRDAVNDLSVHQGLRTLLDRPGADLLQRFPRPFGNRSFEALYRNYKRFVVVGYDSQTGISTLRVTAFRAADAQRMADALLAGGEALVNRLNERSMADAVSQAQRQVVEAQQQSIQAQATLTNFRNQERLIDPDRTSVAGSELVGKLETQLATMRAERAGLAAEAPQSPQLPVLDQRIKAFVAQMESERSSIAGQSNSLAPTVGEYERLSLNRDLAVKTLESAVAALESARIEARRQQLYLDRVVSPNLPDRAERPRRLYSIFTVLMATLVAYGIVSMFIAGLREHRQT